MARSRPFNLTAQLNIQGPNNLRPVIANIRRQLGTLNTNLNININRNASRNIQNLNNQINTLNATLSQTATISQQVAANLNTISASANNVQQNTNRAAGGINNAANAANNLNNNVQQARNSMEDFGRQSALAVRRFIAFSTAAAPIYALTTAISNAFSELVKFDKEVVRLQQVTGQSRSTLSGLTDEISRLSTTLGVSSADLIQVSSTLAQAGLTASQTTTALEALAKASLAPSFDDLTNTVEGSIAAMRQFGISSSQLEGALGSINAVAAAFAVEAGDIIAAIQRTGGVFAAASNGVSQGTDALNEFIAVFTSVRATTRESAETIATGLRTIFTRIQRGSTIDFLRELGIQLTDAEGKFIGPYKAVERLSAALRTLDPRDLRYSQIVEELGGFRQIGKVIPLIQQFATAQQALKVAQEGQGSLAKDAITAQQSLANQFSKVREEFLAFVRSIGESKTFQNITKLVLGLASSLISVGKAFKPILPYLAILGAIRGTQAAVSFGRGFFGGGGGAGGGGQAAPTPTGGPVAPAPTGGATTQQQNVLNNATVVANTNAVTAQTTALGSNTTAIGSLQAAIIQMNNAFVNGVNILARVITQRGAGGQTLNQGGKVLAFARGGVVPGSGNRDTVPAMLQPGEFVIRKKAVETIGADKLHKINKYAKGGRIGRVKNKGARDGDSWYIDYEPTSDVVGGVTTRAIEYDAYEIDKGKRWEKALGAIATKVADEEYKQSDLTNTGSFYETFQTNKVKGKYSIGSRPTHEISSGLKNSLIALGVAKEAKKDNTATGSTEQPTPLQIQTLKDYGYNYNTKTGQTKSLTKKNLGGLIQKFVGGGTVEDIAATKGISVQQAILEQLQALGGGAGIKQILGASAGGSLARKALRKDSIEAGRYLKEATDFVNRALEAKGTGDAAEQARISKLSKVAVAGLIPIGYNKDFEWDIGNDTSVYANVRGLSDRYKEAVAQMQMETSSAAGRFAENLQYSDIFGGGENLAFDFDETLVSGADILGPDGKPDIPKYSDRKVVSSALQQGRLTRLGLKVKELVSANPDFIKSTRVLTARPQSTADLLASTLQRLGLPYTESDITGVGQDQGSTGAKKAANLSAVEKLVDDSLENITAVSKTGKKGFLYNEPKPQPALDELIGQGNIEGAVIEKALALLGANLPPIEQLESNRAVDFPNGLGRAAQFFGVDPNIPTEVKRTLNSDSFERARAEFGRYFIENKFADGGWVQHFNEGAKVRSTKNRRRGAYGKRGFVPLNSREYEAFAEKAYAEAGPYGGSDWSQSAGVPMPKVLADYADKIKKYVFETGGAGISLGKKLVKIPDDIEPEALEALKEDLIRQYDGWYSEIEEVMPFGREAITQTPAAMEREARTQAAARAEAENKVYTQAEDAIGLFKKTGQLSLDPSMDTYIRGTFPEYIKDLEEQLKSTTDADEKTSVNRKLSKAQKAMPDYMALMSGVAVPNQGRITGLSETLYALLDQYGSKDVSVNEIDNIMKALGSKLPDTKRFAMGGKNEDTVPALLTPGEFVINKKAASRIGEQQLNRLNKADKIAGFNRGGPVGSIQRFQNGGGAESRYGAGFIGSGGLDPDQSFIPFDMLSGQANRLAQAQKEATETADTLAERTSKTNRIFGILNTISPQMASKFREARDAMGGTVASLGLAVTTLSTQLPNLYATLDRFTGSSFLSSGAAAGLAGGLQQGGASLFAGLNAAQQAGFGRTGTVMTSAIAAIGGAISGYLNSKEQKDNENLRKFLQENSSRTETLFGRLEQGNLSETKRNELINELDSEIAAADQAIGTSLENSTEKFSNVLSRLTESISGAAITFAALKIATRRSEGGMIYASRGTYVKYQPKGTDTVPAMLSPGEFVVNAKSTRKNLGLLNAINKNNGGLIEPNYLAIGGLAIPSLMDYWRNLNQYYNPYDNSQREEEYIPGMRTAGRGSMALSAALLGTAGLISGTAGAGLGMAARGVSSLGGMAARGIGGAGRAIGSVAGRIPGARGIGRIIGRAGRRSGLADLGMLGLSLGQAGYSFFTGGGPSQFQQERLARRSETLDTRIRRGQLEAQEFDSATIFDILNQAGGMQEGAARNEFLTQSGTSPIVRAAEEEALKEANINQEVLTNARKKSEQDRTEQEKKAIETADAARQQLFEDAFFKNSSKDEKEKTALIERANQARINLKNQKQLTKEEQQAYDEVYGLGQKVIANQSEQIHLTESNNRALTESRAAGENFINAINTIESGLDRASATFSDGLLKIDNSLGLLEGRIPKVSRLTENIFSNLRGYSAKEISSASSDLSRSLGLDQIDMGFGIDPKQGLQESSLGDVLKNASLATRALEVDLPRIFRENAGATGNNLRQQILDSLRVGGLNESAARNIADEIINRANNQTRGGKSVSFGQLSQDVPGFLNSVESLKKANELQAKLLKVVNDNLDEYNSRIQQAAERTVAASEIRATSARTRGDFELNLQQALGRNTSLAQQNAPFENYIRELTTIRGAGGAPVMQGTTDPAALARRSEAAQAELERLQKEQQAAGSEDLGNKKRDAAIKMQTEIILKSNAALQKLAEDGSRAANALNKIQSLRQTSENRKSAILSLFANADNPDFMMDFMSQGMVTQKVRTGQQLNSSDLAILGKNFGNITGMMTSEQAEAFTKQLIAIFRRDYDPATAQMMAEAFDPSQNPEIQRQEAIARSLNEQQIRAQEELARNQEKAANTLIQGLPGAAEEFQRIIKLSAIELAAEFRKSQLEQLFGGPNVRSEVSAKLVDSENIDRFFKGGIASIQGAAFREAVKSMDKRTIDALINQGVITGLDNTRDRNKQIQEGAFSVDANRLANLLQTGQIRFDDAQIRMLIERNAITLAADKLANAQIDLNLSDSARQQLDNFLFGIRQLNDVRNGVGMATGGVVYASSGSIIGMKPKGTDTVPAMLTPGEFVINKAATARNLPLLKSINSGDNYYNNGGIVYAQDGQQVSDRDRFFAQLEAQKPAFKTTDTRTGRTTGRNRDGAIISDSLDPYNKDIGSADPLKAFGISAVKGVVPTAAGMTAASSTFSVLSPLIPASGPFAPAAALGVSALSLGAGVIGAMATSMAQENYLDALAPQTNAEMKRLVEENPTAATLGGVVPGVGAGLAQQGWRSFVGTITQRLGSGAASAGIGAGIEYGTTGAVDPTNLGVNFGVGFAQPNTINTKRTAIEEGFMLYHGGPAGLEGKIMKAGSGFQSGGSPGGYATINESLARSYGMETAGAASVYRVRFPGKPEDYLPLSTPLENLPKPHLEAVQQITKELGLDLNSDIFRSQNNLGQVIQSALKKKQKLTGTYMSREPYLGDTKAYDEAYGALQQELFKPFSDRGVYGFRTTSENYALLPGSIGSTRFQNEQILKAGGQRRIKPAPPPPPPPVRKQNGGIIYANINKAATARNLPLLKSINSGSYSSGGVVNYLRRGGLPTKRMVSGKTQDYSIYDMLSDAGIKVAAGAIGVAEGVLPTIGGAAGAIALGAFGTLGGPAAPVTVPGGVIAGGMLGSMAGDEANNSIGSLFEGTSIAKIWNDIKKKEALTYQATNMTTQVGGAILTGGSRAPAVLRKAVPSVLQGSKAITRYRGTSEDLLTKALTGNSPSLNTFNSSSAIRSAGRVGAAAANELIENSIQNKARGGVVYANNGMLVPYQPKGTDTVPAMLTPGEFVINKTATAKNLPLLKAINNGHTKAYARGGIVYASTGGVTAGVVNSPDETYVGNLGPDFQMLLDMFTQSGPWSEIYDKDTSPVVPGNRLEAIQALRPEYKTNFDRIKDTTALTISKDDDTWVDQLSQNLSTKFDYEDDYKLLNIISKIPNKQEYLSLLKEVYEEIRYTKQEAIRAASQSSVATPTPQTPQTPQRQQKPQPPTRPFVGLLPSNESKTGVDQTMHEESNLAWREMESMGLNQSDPRDRTIYNNRVGKRRQYLEEKRRRQEQFRQNRPGAFKDEEYVSPRERQQRAKWMAADGTKSVANESDRQNTKRSKHLEEYTKRRGDLDYLNEQTGRGYTNDRAYSVNEYAMDEGLSEAETVDLEKAWNEKENQRIAATATSNTEAAIAQADKERQARAAEKQAERDRVALKTRIETAQSLGIEISPYILDMYNEMPDVALVELEWDIAKARNQKIEAEQGARTRQAEERKQAKDRFVASAVERGYPDTAEYESFLRDQGLSEELIEKFVDTARSEINRKLSYKSEAEAESLAKSNRDQARKKAEDAEAAEDAEFVALQQELYKEDEYQELRAKAKKNELKPLSEDDLRLAQMERERGIGFEHMASRNAHIRLENLEREGMSEAQLATADRARRMKFEEDRRKMGLGTTSSAVNAFAIGAAKGVAPTTAGLSAGAYATALAVPLIGPFAPIAGLAAGTIASLATSYSQENYLSALAPETKAKIDQLAAENPVASAIGGAVPGIGVGLAQQGLRSLTGTVTQRLGAGAASASIGAGIEYGATGTIDPTNVGINFGVGFVQPNVNRPNARSSRKAPAPVSTLPDIDLNAPKPLSVGKPGVSAVGTIYRTIDANLDSIVSEIQRGRKFDAIQRQIKEKTLRDIAGQLKKNGIPDQDIVDGLRLFEETGSPEFMQKLIDQAKQNRESALIQEKIANNNATAAKSIDTNNQELDRIANEVLSTSPTTAIPRSQAAALAAEVPQVTNTPTAVIDTASITTPETTPAGILEPVQTEAIVRPYEAPTTVARGEAALSGISERAGLTARESAALAKISDDAARPTTRIDLDQAVSIDKGEKKFKYTAVDEKTGKEINDIIYANDEDTALTLIREKGLLTTNIQKEATPKIPAKAKAKNEARIVYKAAGGSIFKPRGTDTVPAMLTPGEFVVNRKATQANLGLLHEINNNPGTRYYQRGGLVNYLAEGGQPTGGSANLGIDFSPFMDGVTQFSTYVNDFTTAVNSIPTWDFSEFTRGITVFSNTISTLTGSLGPINLAAASFGNAAQNISQAVAALANIPTTITINGRIDMPTQIVVTVEGTSANTDISGLTSDILEKVADGLSNGNVGLDVSFLKNQANIARRG